MYGTMIICYLKQDLFVFMEERRPKHLVGKYSEHSGFPIEPYVVAHMEKPVTDSANEEEEDKEGGAEGDVPMIEEVGDWHESDWPLSGAGWRFGLVLVCTVAPSLSRVFLMCLV
mmetsp:Transcript_31897/g.105826  ORF Transcript_31897/g.105826 Transcript_31897/m.105826 type:complete len:114 (-) Transcript_31897:325-666(-)